MKTRTYCTWCAHHTVITMLHSGHNATQHGLGPKGPGTFAAIGGSNTYGACDVNGRTPCNQTSFAKLTYEALHSAARVHHFQNGGIGAMGPQLAAACSNKFAPPGTRFATVEYLPNLGYVNDDAGELAAIEMLLSVLQRRGARTVLINLVPSARMQRFANCKENAVGCTTHAHIVRLGAALRELAANYSVPTIGIDHDGPDGEAALFGADLMHLNQAGHAYVHKQLMRLYTSWPAWQQQQQQQQQQQTSSASSSVSSANPHLDQPSSAALVPVSCLLGEELGTAIGRSDGFARTNFARDPASRQDKIGWESRSPGASMTLCTRFPREPPTFDSPRYGGPTNRSDPYKYILAVGMQLSHEKNLPLFGLARVTCHGGCRCACRWSHHGAFNSSCIFDGLGHGGGGVTVTAFVRMTARSVLPPAPGGGDAKDDKASAATASDDEPSKACAPDQCAIHIANVADRSRPDRSRVLVRALMAGYEHHHSTKWLNTYHLDAAGLSSYRRERRRRR